MAAVAPLMADVEWFHKTIEQNPEAPGFKEMWRDIFIGYGFQPGDYVVASEPYGKWLAEILDGRFMPYDIDRDVDFTKASFAREKPELYFDMILPEFQKELRQTVTVFGCESTGKTTLSRELASGGNYWWLPEWARPYLENAENVITEQSMTEIWQGQKALQIMGRNNLVGKPWIVQDTDLFSTVGYWDFWNGNTPRELVTDAKVWQSDLYLITQSNIPFETDPLRYGGDKRESDDEFWISLAEAHGLNYRVLESNDRVERLSEARSLMDEHWKINVADKLRFNRTHAGEGTRY